MLFVSACTSNADATRVERVPFKELNIYIYIIPMIKN